MKCIVVTVALMALTMSVSAQKLTVNVSGIRSNVGKVMIGVGDYKKNPAGMTGRIVEADSTGIKVLFNSLPVGESHIYVVHVEQSDFRPEMLGKVIIAAMTSDSLMGDDRPKIGFGVDKSGCWEPLLTTGSEQTVDFKIHYINSKK